MKRAGQLWTLLLEFMRFGSLTFGGGWSIIAQMQQLYVEEKKVITSEELLDLISVARSLPGTMIANVAMLYGYRAAGLAGGIVCVLGMTVPPMLVLIVISFGYNAFRTNYWVMAVMNGMRAAVAPIIANAAVGLLHGSMKYKPCVLVVLLCFCLYLLGNVNAFVLVLIGIAAGFLIGEYYEGKGGKAHGAP